MNRIFTGGFIKKVGGIFKKKKFDITDALKKADELETKELEYEKVIAEIIEELKKIVTSTDESEVEKLLRGIKDIKSNRIVIKFLKDLKKVLRKIRYLLHLIRKFNDENIKVLEGIITAINNYRNTYHNIPRTLRILEELCRERHNSRKKINDFVVKINESIARMLGLIDAAIASTESFDYGSAIRDLQQEKENLVSILTEELKIYDTELTLFKDSVAEEQLKGAVFEHYKAQLWGDTKLIKKKYFLRRLRNIIIATFAGLHLAGIATTTISISYPNILKRYNVYHEELVTRHTKEDVIFRSKGGYNLSGWFFSNPNTNKTIILSHGRSANKSYEMPYVQEFVKHYNVFVFDFRGHGENPYGSTSLGFYETQDLMGALDYLESRGVEEVAILGHSMGGAVAIMAAAQYRSAGIQIKAVVTEGAYANLNELLNRAGKKFLLPPTISWPAKKLTQQIAGYDINTVAPERLIGQVNCPVLIMQADHDNMIPPDSAERLFKAAKGVKELRYFHGEHDVPNSSVADFSLQFLSKVF